MPHPSAPLSASEPDHSTPPSSPSARAVHVAQSARVAQVFSAGPRTGPSRRTVLGGAAGLGALAASVALAGCSSAPATPATTSGSGTTGSGGTGSAPPTTGDVDPEAWRDARLEAATAFVRARWSAAVAGDAAAWLRGVDGAALRSAQAAVLARIRAAGVGAVRVDSVTEKVAPVPAPAGTLVQFDATARLSYRFAGFDSGWRALSLDLSFRADPARPSGLTLTASAPAERPQPWDLAGLRVARTSGSLVLAVGSPATLAEVTRRAVDASSRVAAVWGRAEPSVWVRPATDADAARLLGRDAGGLAGVAAATDGPLEPGHPAGADRIVLVPKVWASLSPAGRGVVMTHELTHATVRASTTRDVPIWLSEGFADFVAYRGLDLPERVVAGAAVDLARRVGVPTALPTAADFEPGSATLQGAYAQSLLAVRTLADTHGRAAVVRLYRAAAGGLGVSTADVGDAAAALDLALGRVLGTDRATLVRAWQARIRRLLAR